MNLIIECISGQICNESNKWPYFQSTPLYSIVFVVVVAYEYNLLLNYLFKDERFHNLSERVV